MSSILFPFESLAQPATLNAIKKAFEKYQSTPLTVEAVTGTKRTSGISYREIAVAFQDSQSLTLRIKQPGDIYQVLLNGKLLPIVNQLDHPRAVREIVDAMDAKRASFQKALARRAVKLPPAIKTAAPKMLATLTQRRDDLIVIRDGLSTQLAELTAQSA
ncbi:MAG: hypothetical protein EOM21_20010 [Gammaproteobacteria bacterium]|nr:hypothetical protein [Gammaproteobacteria bacterium]